MSAAKPRGRKRDWGADRVLCVSPHKDSGGWQIAYVKGGRRCTEKRSTEKAANERAARLQLELAGPHRSVEQVAAEQPADPVASFDWGAVLARVAARIERDAEDENAQRQGRTLASMATAAMKCRDEETVLRRIAAVEAEQERIAAARAAGQADADREIEARASGASGAVVQ